MGTKEKDVAVSRHGPGGRDVVFKDKVIPTVSVYDPVLQNGDFDYVIVGAGISGSWWAYELTRRGARCLLLEAGRYFAPAKYPRQEIDGNSQLYWSGGIEFDDCANLGLLRPKVVGGGSIVNQALVDRFDDNAWERLAQTIPSGVFQLQVMAPWYEKVESLIHREKIPLSAQNGKCKNFCRRFE